MRKSLKLTGLAWLIILLLAGSTWAAFWSSGDDSKEPVEMNNQTVVRLAEKLKPAVVNIDTEATVSVGGPFTSPNMPRDFKDFFERFFGRMPEQKQRRQAMGSGFIVSEDGYIVTNNHVVEKAEKITVRLLDKRHFEAKVVGSDPKTDVALLKIEANDLPHVILGDSDKLKVGEWVLAIGNPFGLDHTLTAGIVSAKGRIIGAGPYDDFIQTDASINPGNSGGPLFNFHGEVVGMNTAIIAQGQGIGFAVPVNVVKDVISQLKDKGRVVRAELGVLIQPVTKELAESFGLEEIKGALISQVMSGSPAEKAGLRRGDIVIAFNDKETKTLTVVLGEQKERLAAAQSQPGEKQQEEPKLGLTVQDITPEIAEAMGLDRTEGVVVTGVSTDSPAQKAGLKQGDLILEVNRQAVKSGREFAKLVGKADKKKPLLLLIQRGQSNLYVPLKWDAD
ncbi:MAG: DegQ family serine endoprotease [Deltaproteobacteria bacterium]|nr:DegQ family serine endoprotease [Deltaproteobacteria bacterium]